MGTLRAIPMRRHGIARKLPEEGVCLTGTREVRSNDHVRGAEPLEHLSDCREMSPRCCGGTRRLRVASLECCRGEGTRCAVLARDRVRDEPPRVRVGARRELLGHRTLLPHDLAEVRCHEAYGF